MNKLFSNRFAFLLLAPLFVLFFFLPHLLKGELPIPADALLGLYHPWRDESYDGYNAGKFPVKNPLITDPVLQTYPWKYQVINNLKDGNLPFWNPYSFSGQPLIANVQSSPFQVLNILFFIFPFNIAWGFSIILPQILLAAFMYLFLRELKVSALAATFGSIILPFSGFFISWYQWGTVVTSAMWLPLMLLLIKKIFDKNSATWLLLLFLSTSQTIFSGHSQTALFVLTLSVSYVLYLQFKLKKIKGLLNSFLALFLGMLFTAPFILSALEFSKYSARAIDQAYSGAREDWFLPLKHLVQIIAPDYFGNPTTYNYWGVWNYAEFVSYIGIIPLGFVLFSFLKNEKGNFFKFWALLGIFLALSNPISKIPYDFKIPILSTMQPSRIIFIVIFSLAVLSSIGFDLFLKEKGGLKKLSIGLVPITAIALVLFYTLAFKNSFPIMEGINTFQVALRNMAFPAMLSIMFFAIIVLSYLKLPKKFLLILIFGLTIFELFRFSSKFSPFSKSSLIFPETATTNYLASQQKPFRILITDRRILNGNSPSVYGIETVQGYDPLYLKDYSQLVNSWNAQKVQEATSFNRIVTPQKYDLPLVNFLNVKFIVTFDDLKEPQFVKVAQEGETKIFKNTQALPRAYFAQGIEKVQSRDKELEKILDSNFNLGQLAVSSTREVKKVPVNASVNFTKYTDQEMKLATFTENEAPLILSNVFYPGWKAFVDGKETEIKRINFMFQSVIVPQGTHEVEVKFQPKSFYDGLVISLTSLAFILVYSYLLWIKKYR